MTDDRRAKAEVRAKEWTKDWPAYSREDYTKSLTDLILSVQEEALQPLRDSARRVTEDAKEWLAARQRDVEPEVEDEPLELGEPDPIPSRPLSRAEVRASDKEEEREKMETKARKLAERDAEVRRVVDETDRVVDYSDEYRRGWHAAIRDLRRGLRRLGLAE